MNSRPIPALLERRRSTNCADIRKEYRLRQPLVQRLRREPKPSVVAVGGVSLTVPKGAVFGLVGESGSGKSTLAQIMVRLIKPTSGQLCFTAAPMSLRA